MQLQSISPESLTVLDDSGPRDVAKLPRNLEKKVWNVVSEVKVSTWAFELKLTYMNGPCNDLKSDEQYIDG